MHPSSLGHAPTDSNESLLCSGSIPQGWTRAWPEQQAPMGLGLVSAVGGIQGCRAQRGPVLQVQGDIEMLLLPVPFPKLPR